jgi:hypothetical protein
MGTSNQPSRSKLLGWLAGFVVVFGAVSWLVTSAVRPSVTPPQPTRPASITPRPTPAPLVCASNELALTGIFNECVTAAPDKSSTCSVSGHALEALLRLAGSHELFLLYIEIKSFYVGPGTYYLPPWQFGLGTNDVPKVAVLQSATGSFWESVGGVVTVTAGDGRSGNLSAMLQASSAGAQASDGNTVLPGPTLDVMGPWSCP